MSRLMLQFTGVEMWTRLSAVSTDPSKAFMIEQGTAGAGSSNRGDACGVCVCGGGGGLYGGPGPRP